MARKGQISFLVLLASIAVTAVAAPAAQAKPEFVCTAKSCFFQGEQTAGSEVVITANAGTVKCKKAFSEGSMTEPSSTATFNPTYSECTAFGFAATVKTNGCQQRFEITSTVSENMEHKGVMDIVCPGGSQVEITAPGCTVKIGSQENLGTVTFVTNTAPIEDVGAAHALTNISYSQSGFLCGSGSFSNGTLAGSTTTKAFETGTLKQINTTIMDTP